jgi:hypothetical protein
MKAVCDPAELRAVGKAFNDAWRQVSTHVSTRADQVDAARLTLFEVLLNLTKDGTCDCAKLTVDEPSLDSLDPSVGSVGGREELCAVSHPAAFPVLLAGEDVLTAWQPQHGRPVAGHRAEEVPLEAAERPWDLGHSNRVVETWKPELHPAQWTVVHMHTEFPLNR